MDPKQFHELVAQHIEAVVDAHTAALYRKRAALNRGSSQSALFVQLVGKRKSGAVVTCGKQAKRRSSSSDDSDDDSSSESETAHINGNRSGVVSSSHPVAHSISHKVSVQRPVSTESSSESEDEAPKKPNLLVKSVTTAIKKDADSSDSESESDTVSKVALPAKVTPNKKLSATAQKVLPKITSATDAKNQELPTKFAKSFKDPVNVQTSLPKTTLPRLATAKHNSDSSSDSDSETEVPKKSTSLKSVTTGAPVIPSKQSSSSETDSDESAPVKIQAKPVGLLKHGKVFPGTPAAKSAHSTSSSDTDSCERPKKATKVAEGIVNIPKAATSSSESDSDSELEASKSDKRVSKSFNVKPLSGVTLAGRSANASSKKADTSESSSESAEVLTAKTVTTVKPLPQALVSKGGSSDSDDSSEPKQVPAQRATLSKSKKGSLCEKPISNVKAMSAGVSAVAAAWQKKSSQGDTDSSDSDSVLEKSPSKAAPTVVKPANHARNATDTSDSESSGAGTQTKTVDKLAPVPPKKTCSSSESDSGELPDRSSLKPTLPVKAPVRAANSSSDSDSSPLESSSKLGIANAANKKQSSAYPGSASVPYGKLGTSSQNLPKTLSKQSSSSDSDSESEDKVPSKFPSLPKVSAALGKKQSDSSDSESEDGTQGSKFIARKSSQFSMAKGLPGRSSVPLQNTAKQSSSKIASANLNSLNDSHTKPHNVSFIKSSALTKPSSSSSDSESDAENVNRPASQTPHKGSVGLSPKSVQNLSTDAYSGKKKSLEKIAKVPSSKTQTSPFSGRSVLPGNSSQITKNKENHLSSFKRTENKMAQSSTSSDSDSSETPKKSAMVARPTISTVKPAASSSDSDSDSESELPKAVQQGAKSLIKSLKKTGASKSPVKSVNASKSCASTRITPLAGTTATASDSSSSDSDSSDDKPPRVVIPPNSCPLKKTHSSSDSSSDSEESPKQSSIKSLQKKTSLGAARSPSNSDSSSSNDAMKMPKNGTFNRPLSSASNNFERSYQTNGGPLKRKKSFGGCENTAEVDTVETFQPAAKKKPKYGASFTGETASDLKNFRKEDQVIEENCRNQRSSPFRRVRAENIQVDPRLTDNSYEGFTKKAFNQRQQGFGDRANQVLKQVKGRDFRHEKTKKKRGTYSGGQIDLSVNSVPLASD